MAGDRQDYCETTRGQSICHGSLSSFSTAAKLVRFECSGNFCRRAFENAMEMRVVFSTLLECCQMSGVFYHFLLLSSPQSQYNDRQ